MKVTSRELDWIVNEESDIKIKILNEEEKRNTKYVEVEFEYKNEKCFISYRYQMENGITFPEDIINMKNIIIVKKEDSDLGLELKNEETIFKEKRENKKKIEKTKSEVEERYKKIKIFKDIKEIKLKKEDIREMKKIIKNAKSIIGISDGIKEFAIKYNVRANDLYRVMLRELNII